MLKGTHPTRNPSHASSNETCGWVLGYGERETPSLSPGDLDLGEMPPIKPLRAWYISSLSPGDLDLGEMPLIKPFRAWYRVSQPGGTVTRRDGRKRRREKHVKPSAHSREVRCVGSAGVNGRTTMTRGVGANNQRTGKRRSPTSLSRRIAGKRRRKDAKLPPGDEQVFKKESLVANSREKLKRKPPRETYSGT